METIYPPPKLVYTELNGHATPRTGEATILKLAPDLVLRTDFIYATHDSLYAVKEFPSIAILVIQAIVLSNLLYLL